MQQREVDEAYNRHKEFLGDAQRDAARSQLDRIENILRSKQEASRAWLAGQSEALSRAYTAADLHRLERMLQDVPPFLPAELRREHAADNFITDETLLVSVQAANNEIGTIQPIAKLAALARERGALFHCDAAQAAGKIPLDVDALDVDLLSLSAHKLYGPKGVGALYLRGGVKGLPLSPLWVGGGQEHGLRSGTLNVPGIVGLGAACALCEAELLEESKRLADLRDGFEAALLAKVPGLQRNGDLNNRLPHNSSLTFPEVDAETLIVNLPELVLSSGSACTAGALEPSYVLQAIGLSREAAYRTLRVGLGHSTTQVELDTAVQLLLRAYKLLAPTTA